ncbi:hypothetical protein JTB14_019452 [Gonioctena quinquepunctata]|nr:hypothetical protein JTB14_019452 [Gonioctena quinquepunctata]
MTFFGSLGLMFQEQIIQAKSIVWVLYQYNISQLYRFQQLGKEMTDQNLEHNTCQSGLTPSEMEKQEEAKLKAKYSAPGGIPGRIASGHSAFLQKRLSKATGDAIPTPETVPARKTSIVQPSKFSNVS